MIRVDYPNEDNNQCTLFVKKEDVSHIVKEYDDKLIVRLYFKNGTMESLCIDERVADNLILTIFPDGKDLL